MHVPLFWQGLDEHGLNWQLLPKNPAGQEHVKLWFVFTCWHVPPFWQGKDAPVNNQNPQKNDIIMVKITENIGNI